MKYELSREEKEMLPEYLQDATNVYRTKNYIVKQVISVRYDSQNFNTLVSTDTFYLRNKSRDEEYEYFLDFTKHINGKRIPTSMHIRRYVK